MSQESPLRLSGAGILPDSAKRALIRIADTAIDVPLFNPPMFDAISVALEMAAAICGDAAFQASLSQT